MECVIHKAGILYQEQHRPETKQLAISPSKDSIKLYIKEIPISIKIYLQLHGIPQNTPVSLN